jgi:CheY-like chemotaxis protein
MNSATVAQSVLVVEDDEALREVIEWTLADEGYAVETAENGAIALERVSGRSPKLILLDMRMPVMDGWAFAREYHGRPGPHAPIVVLTAARDAGTWARDVQATGYLAKPFAIDQLLDTVQRHSA